MCAEQASARGGWDTRALGLGIRELILTDYGAVNNPSLAVDIIPVIAENIDDRSFQEVSVLRNRWVYCTNYLGVTGKDVSKSTEVNQAYKDRMVTLQKLGNRTLMGFGLS